MTTLPTACPPAPYLGGKRNLSKRLCALIETISHRVYVEPFVGMGGIFLRRRQHAPIEVINDLNGEVANLFRVVRRHYTAFIEAIAFLPAGRDEFERQRALDPSALTDIDRAVRFLYLQRIAFGGLIDKRVFGVRRDQSSRFNIGRLRDDLHRLSERLAPVTIEKLDFAALIRRYDGPRVLFYLDPPYDQTAGYGLDFGRERYVELAEQLRGIAGQFVMSINDTPFIRETFAAFDIEEVSTTYHVARTASATAGQGVTELIIRNRPR